MLDAGQLRVIRSWGGFRMASGIRCEGLHSDVRWGLSDGCWIHGNKKLNCLLDFSLTWS